MACTARMAMAQRARFISAYLPLAKGYIQPMSVQAAEKKVISLRGVKSAAPPCRPSGTPRRAAVIHVALLVRRVEGIEVVRGSRSGRGPRWATGCAGAGRPGRGRRSTSRSAPVPGRPGASGRPPGRPRRPARAGAGSRSLSSRSWPVRATKSLRCPSFQTKVEHSKPAIKKVGKRPTSVSLRKGPCAAVADPDIPTS